MSPNAFIDHQPSLSLLSYAAYIMNFLDILLSHPINLCVLSILQYRIVEKITEKMSIMNMA